MPTPVTPKEFKDLVPKANSSLCGKFLPAISDFIRRFSDYYSYVYTEDGVFTHQYIQDLCAIGCVVGGGGGGGGGGGYIPECPNRIEIEYLRGVDKKVELSFTVNGKPPFSYFIYRATSDAGPWGDPIYTGNSTQNTVTYSDENITEGVRYYYKIEITADACSPVELITGSVVAGKCYMKANFFKLTIERPANAQLKLILTGWVGPIIPEGSKVTIYRSDSSDTQGVPLVESAPIEGGEFSLIDSDVIVGVRYYYTVIYKQADECTEIIMRANQYATSNVLLPAPTVTKSRMANRLEWDDQSDIGIEYYGVIIKSPCGGGKTIFLPPNDTPENDVVVYTILYRERNYDSRSKKWFLYYQDMPFNCYSPGMGPPIPLTNRLWMSTLYDSSAYDFAIYYKDFTDISPHVYTNALFKSYSVTIVGYKQNLAARTRTATIS